MEGKDFEPNNILSAKITPSKINFSNKETFVFARKDLSYKTSSLGEINRDTGEFEREVIQYDMESKMTQKILYTGKCKNREI